MGISTKVETFNIGTGAATTTVARTGYGFTPIFLIFMYCGRTETTDTAGGNNSIRGMGWVTSTSSRRVVASQSEDAVGTSNCDTTIRNDTCIAAIDTAGASDGLADLQSLDAGGFTLVIDEQFTVDLAITVLAVGGSDITNVAIVDANEPATATTQAITGVGAQPDALLGMSVPAINAPNSIAVDARFTIGISDGTNDATFGVASDNGQGTSDTAHYALDGEFFGAINAGLSAVNSRASVQSFDADGMTMNWAAVQGSQFRNYHYLAITGAKFAVGSAVTENDTVTTIPITGAGFHPQAGLVISAVEPENTSPTMAAKDEISFGAFNDMGEQNSQGVRDGDNVGTTVVGSAVDVDSVYVNLNSTSDAVEGEMILNSLDSDGATFIMTDADPANQNYFAVLFIGASSLAIMRRRREMVDIGG